MPRRTIITSHNSKSYQVDGLTFDVRPETHVFKWILKDKKSGTKVERETNMVDYFREHYNIRIDKDEPLLWVNFRDEKIFLPTSLCFEAALPDDFTKDKQKMRDLDQYKVKNPGERFDRIETLKNRLMNNEEFTLFKLALNPRMAEIQGQVLHPPML